MPTARGRANREGEALQRIQDAQNIINDALGITLSDLPAERSRDPQMRHVLMLEQWAHWLEQIAAAMRQMPPQEVIMGGFLDTLGPSVGMLAEDDNETNLIGIDIQGDEVPMMTKLMIQGRYWEALHKAGIDTIADIPDNDTDLLNIPGIGPAAVQEIRDAQARLNDQTD